MGSFSESCGFSGLEISERDHAYVMLIKKGGLQAYSAASLYDPQTTLIRGSYEDYGHLGVDDDQAILDIFNKQSGLQLVNGEEFSLDILDETSYERYWVRAEIFEHLGTLEPEYPYVFDAKTKASVRIKDIEEEVMKDFEANQVFFLETYEKLSKNDFEFLKPTNLDKEDLIDLFYMNKSTMKYQTTGVDIWYYKEAVEMFKKDELIDPTALLTARKRNQILLSAARELRKKIIPSEAIGPQHGGEVAMAQFAKKVLDLSLERKVDRDD